MNLTNLPSRFLRRVLLADAVTSGATGLAMMLGAGRLEQLLGIPEPLLRYSGLSLLPFAALVGYTAMRASVSRAAVRLVACLNVLWAVDSILLLAAGWIEPTTLGSTFVIAQAVIVAMFAEFQYFGLKKLNATVA
jgi:hypothetical protein